MDEAQIKQQQLAKFQSEVDHIRRGGFLTYIEAIAEYCERRSIDVEDVKKFITPHMKAEIISEAKRLNQVKRGSFGASLDLE